MIDETQDVIANGSAIIEKFGGIRPMASKLGIPVTTVQGWKQRNAIPASRRDDIIRAAVQNRINLDDLLIGITAQGQPDFEQASLSKANNKRADFDTNMPDAKIARPLFYAGILMMAGVLIGGVFAVAPHIKNLGQQDEKIAALQAELEQARLEQLKLRQQAEAKPAPTALEQRLAELQGKVGELSQQAQSYSAVIDDLKTGGVTERIAKLEGRMHQMLPQTSALSLSGMLQKVQGMQQSQQGAASLAAAANAILAQLEGSAALTEATPEEQDAHVTQSLATLSQSDPAVAQALGDVPPEDMKAAAMLLGMAQLRQSLARDNDSFDTDLAILKQTAARDNPELQAAIDRLAPQAKTGVLTPDGLSHEFRGMAGDIVAASLSGQDVKFEDKLRARINDVMVVKKGDEQISGTHTQQVITAAQTKLDKGDVAGAVELLQTLDGPAAQKSSGFIAQAQATMAAQGLQQALGQNIIQKLQGAVSLGGPSPGINTGALTGLVSEIQGMMPGQGLVQDKASGTNMYVPAPQVKIPTLAPRQ